LTGREHSEDLGVDGRTISKPITDRESECELHVSQAEFDILKQ